MFDELTDYELLQCIDKEEYGQYLRFYDNHQKKEFWFVGAIEHYNNWDQLYPSKDWLYGFIGYDLKNKVENIFSKNKDFIGANEMGLYRPKYVFSRQDHGSIQCLYTYEKNYSKLQMLLAFVRGAHPPPKIKSNYSFTPQTSKQEYLEDLKAIKAELQYGNIYEMNYCMTYESENFDGHCPEIFIDIDSRAKAPFSSYLKAKELNVLCFSPERFLQKKENVLVSSPIKGTRKRASDPQLDEALKQELQDHPKDRSENIMIVDLVRNDLSKIALPKTVKVDELCKVYTFEAVHQLISTVRCEVSKDISFKEIIRATFPMGSMTGAPKLSAMQIAEKLERFKRGIYSGALGYVAPNGDFDFNVVIRSVIANAKTKKAIIPVGGAITIESDPEEEYKECYTKAKMLLEYFEDSI